MLRGEFGDQLLGDGIDVADALGGRPRAVTRALPRRSWQIL